MRRRLFCKHNFERGALMFQRMINDLKDSTGTALRLTSLAAAAAGALFIATSVLCAAAFVFVYQRYGLAEACLTGAGVSLAVPAIRPASYMPPMKPSKSHSPPPPP